MRCVGALTVALPACPVIKGFQLLGYTKLYGLYIARLTLVRFLEYFIVLSTVHEEALIWLTNLTKYTAGLPC